MPAWRLSNFVSEGVPTKFGAAQRHGFGQAFGYDAILGAERADRDVISVGSRSENSLV